MKRVILILLLAVSLFAQTHQRIGETADTLIVGNNGFIISPTGLITAWKAFVSQ